MQWLWEYCPGAADDEVETMIMPGGERDTSNEITDTGDTSDNQDKNILFFQYLVKDEKIDDIIVPLTIRTSGPAYESPVLFKLTTIWYANYARFSIFGFYKEQCQLDKCISLPHQPPLEFFTQS